MTANKPVLVAHYLKSMGGWSPTSGDPGLAFAVPIPQYRNRYNLLVPSGYIENYYSVAVKAGAAVQLDGATVPADQFQAFGDNPGWQFVRLLVEPGPHTIECPGDNGCGVEAYGWAAAVSYIYEGGLDIREINPP